MHARIGSPGTRDLDRLREERRERGLQRAGDGAQRRLPLKPAELRAVVFDGEAQVDQDYLAAAMVKCARRSSPCARAKSRRNAASCIIT